MNNESLQAVKTQCQAAANAFQQLQGEHPHPPEAQMDFNYAVLLALKGLYDAVEAIPD
jgi:hypothetical protein